MNLTLTLISSHSGPPPVNTTSRYSHGAAAEEASLLQLQLVNLLLPVHLDDQGNDEDEEGGASYPRRLSGAFQEALRYAGGVRRRFLAAVQNGRV